MKNQRFKVAGIPLITADHGSVVMLPDGRILARMYGPNGEVTPVDLVSVAWDDLHYWWRDGIAFPALRPMVFTPEMSQELGRLTACVIGVSGTGSVTAEQVCRLGFGRVIGIDHDYVEEKNLNRILNTTLADAKGGRPRFTCLPIASTSCGQPPFSRRLTLT